MTPRLDGCHLWRLIKMKYGVDLLDLSFRLLLEGDQWSLPDIVLDPPLCPGNFHLEFFLQKPRESFRITEEKPEGLLHRQWYYREGEEIRPINQFLEKTGYQIRGEA